MKHALDEAAENSAESFEAMAYYQLYSPINAGGHTPLELQNYQREHSLWGLYGPFTRMLGGSVSAQILHWLPLKFRRNK